MDEANRPYSSFFNRKKEVGEVKNGQKKIQIEEKKVHWYNLLVFKEVKKSKNGIRIKVLHITTGCTINLSHPFGKCKHCTIALFHYCNEILLYCIHMLLNPKHK